MDINITESRLFSPTEMSFPAAYPVNDPMLLPDLAYGGVSADTPVADISLDLPPAIVAAITFSASSSKKRQRSPSPPPRTSYFAALADYEAAKHDYNEFLMRVRRSKQTDYDKRCLKNLREMVTYFKEIVNAF